MRATNTFRTTVVAMALGLGALAACGGGGSSGGGGLGKGDGSKGGNGGSDKNATSTPSSDGSGSTGSGGGSGGSNVSRELDVKIQVVNVYSLAGKGAPIDIWAGTPQSGKKLTTLDYGKTSDVLTPLASKFSLPEKIDGKDVYSYTMSFYAEGGTTEKEQVAQQGEKAFPGDELTILVGPGLATPQSFAPDAGKDVVLFTKSGNPTSSNDASLFEKAEAPAGKGLVYVSALGVPVAENPSSNLTFDVGQEGKGCLPETGPQAPRPGDTHSRTLTSPDSIGGFFYVVPPGTQQLGLYGARDAGCKGTPLGGPFEVTVNSGDHAGLVVYGPPDDLKSLTLPL